MAAELKPRLTFDEYLELESQNEYKSEFIDGQMYAMTGASPRHNLHYVREADNRWVLSDFKSLEEVIQLPSIDCQLALAEVYDKVEWGASV